LPAAIAARVDRDAVIERAECADRVEALESKTDRVHQAMARGAELILHVIRHALAARERLVFGGFGQSRIHVGRRWRHLLAEQLFANEDAALRRGCLGRSRVGGEKRRLSENSGTR